MNEHYRKAKSHLYEIIHRLHNMVDGVDPLESYNPEALDYIPTLLVHAREHMVLGARMKNEEEKEGGTMQWRDISTAPKDNTEILVCKATDAHGNPMGKTALGLFTQRAAWWPDEDDEGGEWVVYCSLPQEPRLFFEPTHWMPIPPPPET